MQVILNGAEIAVLDTDHLDQTVDIDCDGNVNTLDLLVENMGRVNYAESGSPILNQQRKGIEN